MESYSGRIVHIRDSSVHVVIAAHPPLCFYLLHVLMATSVLGLSILHIKIYLPACALYAFILSQFTKINNQPDF